MDDKSPPTSPATEFVNIYNLGSTGAQGGAGIPYGVPAVDPRVVVHRGGAVYSIDPPKVDIELWSKLQEKDAELAKTQKELLELARRQEAHLQLRSKYDELQKKENFRNILYSVEQDAQKKLLADQDFANEFSKENCYSYVMSVDIRKSTDLMLKAVKPSQFATFIRKLCESLRTVVFNNHGVFDKFTGDGILAFFPEFHTGDDAGLLVVKAANECHEVFGLSRF